MFALSLLDPVLIYVKSVQITLYHTLTCIDLEPMARLSGLRCSHV